MTEHENASQIRIDIFFHIFMFELENMLKESPRFNELKNMLNAFNNPQKSATLSESGDNTPKVKENFLDLSKKSVEELIDDKS